MAISDYSTTASSNTSISGINIAEGCDAPNINNAIRQMMADVASGAVTIAGIQTLTNKTLTGPTINAPTITSLTTDTLSATSTANITGDFSVNTSKMTVAATTGNTSIAGNLAINTSKLTVDASTGNTAIAGTLQTTGALTPIGGIVGTTTNDNANSGNIGECVSSSVNEGSAVSLSNSVAKTITSITLTAGDWDVDGSVCFHPANSTPASLLSWATSLVNNALDTPESGRRGQLQISIPATVNNYQTFPTSRTRISVASPTTVYLIAYATFTVSTCVAFGHIEARRVR